MVEDVLDRAVELQDAACDCTVGEAALDALQEYGLTAEVVLTVGHSACAGTVGDEDHLSSLHLGDDGIEAGIDVEGIGDKLDRHVLGRERRADYTGVAVCEGGHRVEEVGSVVDAVACGTHRLVEVRAGVAHRDEDVGIGGDPFDGGVALIHLGCEGDRGDDVGVLEDEVGIWCEDVFLSLRALLRGVDEGALGVYAEYLGAVPDLALLFERANRIKCGDDLGHRHGHRGRKEGGNAILRDAVRHFPDAIGLCVRGILAEVAVDMYVDKSGRDVVACGVNDARTLGGGVGDRDNLACFTIEGEGFALEDGIRGDDLSVHDVG